MAKAEAEIPMVDVGEDSQVPFSEPRTPELSSPQRCKPLAMKPKEVVEEARSEASDASISYDRSEDGTLLPSNLNAKFDKVADKTVPEPTKQACM